MSEVNYKFDDGYPPLRPYMAKELMCIYDVCVKTWYRWMAKHKDAIGEKSGWYYTVRQVAIMYEKLGRPPLPEDRKNKTGHADWGGHRIVWWLGDKGASAA